MSTHFFLYIFFGLTQRAPRTRNISQFGIWVAREHILIFLSSQKRTFLAFYHEKKIICSHNGKILLGLRTQKFHSQTSEYTY